MSSVELGSRTTAEGTGPLLDLTEKVFLASGLEELAQHLLPGIAEILRLTSVCLYIADPRLPVARFFHHGSGLG